VTVDHYARVLRWLERFIAEAAQGEPQRRLLDTALEGLRRHIAESRADDVTIPSIDYLFAICAAVQAPDLGSVTALAGACSLVFLGLDILDDAADGDRPPHWGDCSAAEINLAGATVLSTLPALAVARLDIPADLRAAMQQTLSCGLLRMSAGQHADLAMTDTGIVDPERVEASVIGKSGEQLATYCTLAAQLVGLPDAQIADYAEMGRHFGTAEQLLSDCHELLCDPDMRDLAHGARTLPVALYLARLGNHERPAFLALLDRARHDKTARLEARDRIRATGVVRRVLVKAELYRQHARRAAARACPAESPRRALDRILGGFGVDPAMLDNTSISSKH
jgi:hypothetical protein